MFFCIFCHRYNTAYSPVGWLIYSRDYHFYATVFVDEIYRLKNYKKKQKKKQK